MKLDQEKFWRLMEFIEAADTRGASFDDKVESLNAMYPSMPANDETTQNKVGMDIPERKFLLDLMFEQKLVRGDRHKNGEMGLLLTLGGHEWLGSGPIDISSVH